MKTGINADVGEGDANFKCKCLDYFAKVEVIESTQSGNMVQDRSHTVHLVVELLSEELNVFHPNPNVRESRAGLLKRCSMVSPTLPLALAEHSLKGDVLVSHF